MTVLTEVAKIATATVIVTHMTRTMMKNAEAGVAVIADVIEAETAMTWMSPPINSQARRENRAKIELSGNLECRSKTSSPRGIKSLRSPQPPQGVFLCMQAPPQSSKPGKAKPFLIQNLLRTLPISLQGREAEAKAEISESFFPSGE